MTRNTVLQILVIVVHIVLTLTILSPDEVFNKEPIYSGDYPLHLYRSYRAIESEGFNGYDPYLMAGNIFTAGHDIGARPMQVLCKVFYFIRPELVFKIYVFLALMLVPFVIFQAAKDFGFSNKEITLILILGLLFTWRPLYNYVLITHGVINFFFASYLSLLLVSSFYKYSVTNGQPRKITILILSVSLIFMHVLSVLIVLIPLFIIFILNIKKYKKKAYLYLFTVCMVTVLINYQSFMDAGKDALKVFVNKNQTKVLSDSRIHQISSDDYKEPLHLTDTNIRASLSKSFFSMSASPLLQILLLFLIPGLGIYELYKGERKQLSLIFIGWLVFFCYLRYFGSYSGFFVKTQPVRFEVPLLFALIFPITIGTMGIFSSFCNRLNLQTYETKLLFGIKCFTLIIFSIVLFKYVSKDDINARLPNEGKLLVEWIRSETDGSGRILLESSEAAYKKEKVYYEGHFPAILPYITRREFISTTMLNPGFSKFIDEVLFDKHVVKYEEEEIRELFELYNISFIVCWSEAAITKFQSIPDSISFVTQIGRFYIFRTNIKPSYFLKGNGDIKADYNILTVENIESEDNEVIIKYHWDKHLAIDPQGVINEEKVSRDSIGFIRVKNTPKNFRIYYKN